MSSRRFSTLAVAFAALSSEGCAFGYGSVFPGQERAREFVDTRVCFETEAGCVQAREHRTAIPARSYSALVFPTMYLGGGSTRAGDTRFGTFTADISAEYIRGRGPWSIGARGDFVLAFDVSGASKAQAYTGSLMPVGHYGLNDMFGVYAGIGPGLVSTVQVDAPQSGQWVGRALLGAQMGLGTYRGARILKTRLLLNVEASAAQSLGDQSFESWALTGGLMITL